MTVSLDDLDCLHQISARSLTLTADVNVTIVVAPTESETLAYIVMLSPLERITLFCQGSGPLPKLWFKSLGLLEYRNS